VPTFILSLNWTEQGIRSVKETPKRAQAIRDLGKRMGVDIKSIYLTTGDSDLLAIVEATDDDNVAKFAMTLAAAGNVRTRAVRAWPEAKALKLISELP
jgi:uncharacterized protein with GYD domain